MENEKWKSVVGFEGCYEVSDCGSVRSLPRLSAKGSRLKGQPIALVANKNDGYLRVNLRGASGEKTTKLLHRVVAEAFIDNPDLKPEVNHKDGNKRNNHAHNLEWCTASENQQHALKNGLRKLNDPSHSKMVGMFQENGELLRTLFPSVAEAARITQTSPWAIYNRCQGRVSRSHLGMVWGYIPDRKETE